MAGGSRFGFGLAVGVGLGILAVVLLGAGAWFVSMSAIRSLAMEQAQEWGSSKVVVVESSEPWIVMTDGSHGHVSGYSVAGSGSSDDMPYGAVGYFGISTPTQQDGVRGYATTRVWVTRDTELLRGGKPWRPKDLGSMTPAEWLFDEDTFDDDGSFLYWHELTVDFERKGADLVAQRIDSSKGEKEPPYWMDSEF